VFGEHSAWIDQSQYAINLPVTSDDDSTIYRVINLPNNQQSTLFFTSGFVDSLNSLQSKSPMRFFVLLRNNTVVEAAYVVWPKVRFLNAMGDVPEMDIYLDKKKIVSGLKRYALSPTIELFPKKSQQLVFTFKDSAFQTLFWAQNSYWHNPGEETIDMMYGLVDDNKFKPIPTRPLGWSSKGIDIFHVKPYNIQAGSCELYTSNVCTDCPELKVSISSWASLLYGQKSSGIPYSNANSGTLTWSVADMNNVVLQRLNLQMKNRDGLMGVAFMAGFYDTAWVDQFGEKPQANLPFKIMVAWADQQVDTFKLENSIGIDVRNSIVK